MNSGSGGGEAAKDYLTEGHLAIGVIPDTSAGIGGVYYVARQHSPERSSSSSEEEEVMLNRPQVSWRFRNIGADYVPSPYTLPEIVPQTLPQSFASVSSLRAIQDPTPGNRIFGKLLTWVHDDGGDTVTSAPGPAPTSDRPVQVQFPTTAHPGLFGDGRCSSVHLQSSAVLQTHGSHDSLETRT